MVSGNPSLIPKILSAEQLWLPVNTVYLKITSMVQIFSNLFLEIKCTHLVSCNSMLLAATRRRTEIGLIASVNSAIGAAWWL